MRRAIKTYALDYILPPAGIILVLLGGIMGIFSSVYFYGLIPVGFAIVFYSVYR